MSSKNTVSDQSSHSSSPVPRASPRSLIVSKVSLDKDETWLFNELNATYSDVKRVSRNHDQDGNELSSIRVDFQSEDIVEQILYDEAIYIRNKPHYIRPYWSRICYRCNKEGHVSAECPQYSLPEWRLAELIEEQKFNFQNLLNEFEDRWNTRISILNRPKPTTNTVQLTPVMNNLHAVCQQINQQNVQMQQQLRTIGSQMNTLQIKVNS